MCHTIRLIISHNPAFMKVAGKDSHYFDKWQFDIDTLLMYYNEKKQHQASQSLLSPRPTDHHITSRFSGTKVAYIIVPIKRYSAPQNAHLRPCHRVLQTVSLTTVQV